MAHMVKPRPNRRVAVSPPVKLEVDSGPEGPILSSNAAAHCPDTEDSSAFAWEVATISKISKRVAIKQKALDDAFSCAENIVGLLTKAFDGENQSASHVQEDPEFQAWKAEIDGLKQQHRSLEILVGVAGATGAGKSTILNMLLQRPHLLPSSNSEASTASACQVKYNHDKTRDHMFRAEVDFHTYEEMLYDLKKLDEAFGMTGNLDDESLSTHVERMEEVHNNEAYISEEMKKIKAVWRLDREQAQMMTPEALLESDEYVRSLLGSTQHISCADSMEFAELIKPYVDSSPIPEGFEVWPLVKHVKLYVKSDMLKEGITLVDLPGLSDAVESRARVAQRSFEQLDTTIIVTRSIRAIDEKTGVDLMNDYQALQMQANGTFKKKQFCVVASQMDEIDVEGFRIGSQAAKANVSLQRDIEENGRLINEEWSTGKELKSLRKRTEAHERNLEKTSRRLKTLEAKKDVKRGPKAERQHREKLDTTQERVQTLRVQVSEHRRSVDKLHQKLHELKKSLEACEGRAKWTCIRMRHEHIAKRIKDNMKSKLLSRQEQGKKHETGDDGVVEVFSVSAQAYRGHLRGRPPAIFPETSYTGIPQLRAWIRASALEKRENHLNMLLKALHRLLNGIQQWSNVKSENQTFSFSRRNVRAMLSEMHKKQKPDLDTVLHHWASVIGAVDPFRNLKREILVSKDSVGMVVLRWAHKYPEDTTKTVYMAHGTYDAILRRDGGTFTSRGAERRLYNFTEALAVPFLRVMSDSWQTILHGEIPAFEALIMKPIEDMWHPYVDKLLEQIETRTPATLHQLQKCRSVLRRILEEIRLKVRENLAKLSRSSSKVQPKFRDGLQIRLVPLFRDALCITGPGSFKRRRNYLQQHVVESIHPMFDFAYLQMGLKYELYRERVLERFLSVSTFAFSKVTEHIDLLLASLKKTKKRQAWSATSLYKEEADDTIALKKKVAALAKEWEHKWRFLGEVEDFSSGSLELPVEYVRHPTHDLMDTEEDSDEEEEDDDSEDEEIDMDEDGEEDEDCMSSRHDQSRRTGRGIYSLRLARAEGKK